MRKVPDNLQAMVAGVVESLGYELWGIEMLPRAKSGQLLRIYIETPQGVGVSDCEKVSRQVGAVLDVEDPIHGDYTLEVSSPGMDRPLFSAQQYARFVGDDVRVKLHAGVSGRKNYRGTLLSVDDARVRLQVDQETVELAMDEIEKARVVPKF